MMRKVEQLVVSKLKLEIFLYFFHIYCYTEKALSLHFFPCPGGGCGSRSTGSTFETPSGFIVVVQNAGEILLRFGLMGVFCFLFLVFLLVCLFFF